MQQPWQSGDGMAANNGMAAKLWGAIRHPGEAPGAAAEAVDHYDDSEDEDGGSPAGGAEGFKKPRFSWTDELHARFVAAVNYLGLENAKPQPILEQMLLGSAYQNGGIIPDDAPGLKNVKSHLQKYRAKLAAQQNAVDGMVSMTSTGGAPSGMHQPVSPYMPSSLLTAADHRHIAAQLNPVMDAAPVPAQPPMAHLAFPQQLDISQGFPQHIGQPQPENLAPAPTPPDVEAVTAPAASVAETSEEPAAEGQGEDAVAAAKAAMDAAMADAAAKAAAKKVAAEAAAAAAADAAAAAAAAEAAAKAAEEVGTEAVVEEASKPGPSGLSTPPESGSPTNDDRVQ